MKQGSTCVAFAGVAGLLAGPTFGRLADRGNRVWTLCLGLLMTAASYGALALHSNPFQVTILGAAFMQGFSQIGATVTSQAFVQQQALPEVRGVILGMYGMCGGVGQIISVFTCGQLFSRWTMQSPFALMGLMNLCVMLTCLLLHKKVRDPSQSSCASPLAGASATNTCGDS
uniref:Major facilitator superfamily (MFS) profile domain-containing protein n=1 Tax=Pyrodinium bahamense TaxID=73915 RepID=A0A7S0AA85_9DINO